jgi:hypothetical protein
MRTKTLLLAAATLAAGLATSTAQTVYSQNVVGYINQVIPVGFSMIANQVDYDGTGTNNTLANIFPSAPINTHVYKFTDAGYSVYTYVGSWVPNSSLTLNPGEGVFINNPGPNPITNTFVGTVLQGTFTNAVPVGFSMKGYNVPISGVIGPNGLGYPAATGDHIYTWTGTNYQIFTYLGGSTWVPSEPTINVGQSFFINRFGTSTNWVVNFTVQ